MLSSKEGSLKFPREASRWAFWVGSAEFGSGPEVEVHNAGYLAKTALLRTSPFELTIACSSLRAYCLHDTSREYHRCAAALIEAPSQLKMRVK